MNDLFELVKSLDKKEVLHFKKNVTAKNSSYVKLFDLIYESKKIDEEKFIKNLDIKDSAINYAVLKNYLYNELIKSQIDYQQMKVDELQTYRLFEAAKLFFEKGLYSQSLKGLKSVLKKAEYQENYEFISAIYNYMQSVEYSFIFHTSFKKIEEFRLQRKEFEDRYLYLKRVMEIFNKAYHLGRISQLRILEDEKSDFLALSNDAIFKQPCQFENLLIQHFYTGAQCLIHNGLNQYQQAFEKSQMWLQIWERMQDKIKYHENAFLVAYQAILDSVFNSFHLQLFTMVSNSPLLGELHSVSYRARAEIVRTNATIKFLHKKANYEELAKRINEFAIIFEEKLPFIGIDMKITQAGSLMISYFVLGNLDKSFDWLMKIRDWNKEFKREDIQNFIAAFELLIILEKNQIVLLRNKAKSVYQYFYLKQRLRPIEKSFISSLKKAAKATNRHALELFNIDMFEQLNQYAHDSDQQFWFKYFNFLGWFESKVRKISYIDYVREKVSESGIHKSYE